MWFPGAEEPGRKQVTDTGNDTGVRRRGESELRCAAAQERSWFLAFVRPGFHPHIVWQEKETETEDSLVRIPTQGPRGRTSTGGTRGRTCEGHPTGRDPQALLPRCADSETPRCTQTSTALLGHCVRLWETEKPPVLEMVLSAPNL